MGRTFTSLVPPKRVNLVSSVPPLSYRSPFITRSGAQGGFVEDSLFTLCSGDNAFSFSSS